MHERWQDRHAGPTAKMPGQFILGEIAVTEEAATVPQISFAGQYGVWKALQNGSGLPQPGLCSF